MRPVSHGTVLQFFGRPSFGQGMVETDENRLELYEVQRAGRSTVRAMVLAKRAAPKGQSTRIVRVQTGCSPVELQPHFGSGMLPEPQSGVAPDPTVYETVARLSSCKGTEATARPARTPLRLQRKDSNLHLSQ